MTTSSSESNSSQFGRPLTWNELANLYPGKARIRPMDDVFAWAERQTDRFAVDAEGYIYLKHTPKE